MQLEINGKTVTVTASPDTPLLWVLRDKLGMTGTKYGCGVAQCGACTVHLNGEAIRACVTPVAAVAGQRITTIEGVGATAEGKAVQLAWKEAEVVQCGFCQSGQIMSAAALLKEKSDPGDADIDQAMVGNICRCNTYHRIRAGIHLAAKKNAGGEPQ